MRDSWHRRMGAVCIVAAAQLLHGIAESVAGTPIVVHDATQLAAALHEARPGQTIYLPRGHYLVDQGLTVPDGVTLSGDGVMLFDAAGLPTGFAPGTESVIRVGRGFAGDLLKLGNGATLRGLVLLDDGQYPDADGHRSGNVVAVISRSPGDVIDASIVECEIVNSNESGFAEAGPRGRGLVVITDNPGLGLAPPPHVGATVQVRMEHSIAHSTRGGDSVFVDNFASRGQLHVALIENRIEGRLDAGGGTNRPDAVDHASVMIESDRNLYTGSAGAYGWMLYGGSSNPHLHTEAATRFNMLQVRSAGDRIDGVGVGILAAAARRVLVESGAVSDNTLSLDLERLQISTRGAQAADVQFYAALAGRTGTESHTVGLNNVLRVRMSGTAGSGPRDNIYALQSGPGSPTRSDDGNRIEIVGTPDSFARMNTHLEPPPPAAFFDHTD
jgi:hypothetical protein